jgi:hypothetical protein
MTLRTERWKSIEKALWIVTIAVLWAVDVHNIMRDQKTHDDEPSGITQIRPYRVS